MTDIAMNNQLLACVRPMCFEKGKPRCDLRERGAASLPNYAQSHRADLRGIASSDFQILVCFGSMIAIDALEL
jgi:hypothetical protein